MAYKFQSKIASCGYHIYKNVIWDNVKPGDKVTVEIESNNVSKRIDPYCCAVKAMAGNPIQLRTVGHIPREISRHVYFFLKEENGKVDGLVYSTKYRPSPIPAGGLEIPLLLNFNSTRYITHIKMKGFVTSLYSYDYEPEKSNDDEDDGNEEQINIVIEDNDEIENEETDDCDTVMPKKMRRISVIRDENKEGHQKNTSISADVAHHIFIVKK